MERNLPIDEPRSMPALDRALREAPRLGEDAEAFARDVLESREALGELDDPWEASSSPGE